MSIERLKILESLPLVAAHNVPGNASATTKGKAGSFSRMKLTAYAPFYATYNIIARVAKWLFVLTNSGFGARSAKALELVDVSILPKADEPLRQEARVVLETTVTDGMWIVARRGVCIYVIDDPAPCTHSISPSKLLNTPEMLDSYGKMHGACIIHLVDMYVAGLFSRVPDIKNDTSSHQLFDTPCNCNVARTGRGGEPRGVPEHQYRIPCPC